MRALKSITEKGTRNREQGTGRLSLAFREAVAWKDSRCVLPANRCEIIALDADYIERPEFGESGAHREVGAPEQSFGAECVERPVKHPAIDATAREIGKNVCLIANRREGVAIIA